MAIAQLPKLKELARLTGSSSSARVDTTDKIQLEQLLQLVGNQAPAKPMMNPLEWLLTLPQAIGSLPDAFLDSQKRGGNIFQEYFKNIGQGLERVVTREKSDDPLKTFADVLDKYDVLQGKDAVSKLGRGVLGFAGDVATDPLSLISFGASSLAKKGGESIARTGLSKILAGSSDDALKVLGKEITSNPALVTALKFGTNPIGSVAGTAFRGGKAALPEKFGALEDTFNKLFNKKGQANKVSEDLAGQLDWLERSKRAVERSTVKEQGAIIREINALPQNLKDSFYDFYEGVQKAPTELEPLIAKMRAAIEPGQEIWKKVTNQIPVEKQYDTVTQEGLFGEATSFTNRPQDIIPEIPDQLDLIPDTRRTDVPYLRSEGLGLKEKYFKDKAPIILEELKKFPEVRKDLAGPGYVTFETLDKIGKTSPELGVKIQGLTDPLRNFEGSEMARTYDTRAAGEAAGVVYDKDIGKQFAKTVANPIKAELDYNFGKGLTDIKDNTGNKLFFTPEEVRLQNAGRIPKDLKEFEIKNIGSFYAPPEVIGALKNYSQDFLGDQGTKSIMKLYDDFTNFFKATVTAKGPGVIGFNIRNAIGDFQNMIAGGFRNRGGAFGMGQKTVQFEDLLEREGREVAVSKFGDEVAELYDRAIKSGSLGTGTIDDLAQKLNPGGRLEKLSNATDKLFRVDLQRRREEIFRIANLYDAFKRTDNWEEAGKIARLSSLDYSNLTAFERNVMKRIVPFYSFMRQNLELQLNVLSKSPGMFVGQQKFFNNIKTVLEDSNATKEDYDTLPDWMKTGITAITGKEGPIADVLTGFGDPQSQFADSLSKPLSSLGPLMKLPLEMTTGVEAFTGMKIDERKSGERYSKMPEALKDFLDYREVKRTKKDGTEFTEKTVDGRKVYLLQSVPLLSPLLTATKRGQEAQADPKYLLNLLSGGRIYETNLDTEKLRREREVLQALQQQLEAKGLGKTSENFYIPKEEAQMLAELLAGR